MLTVVVKKIRKGLPYTYIAFGYVAASALIGVAPPSIYGSWIYMAGAGIHLTAAAGSIGNFKWALAAYLIAAVVIGTIETCFLSNHLKWLFLTMVVTYQLRISEEMFVAVFGLLIAASVLIKVLIWQKVAAEMSAMFEKKKDTTLPDV